MIGRYRLAFKGLSGMLQFVLPACMNPDFYVSWGKPTLGHRKAYERGLGSRGGQVRPEALLGQSGLSGIA